MSTLGIVQLLFAAIALVMVGLGLSLEIDDFRRVARERRAVAVALGLHMIVMPLAAYLLAIAFRLYPPYAVGLMLLAAVPGSISSNLYSHVFGGNVALNMSLTGVNTVVSMATVPVICGWALSHFQGVDSASPEVVGKLAEAMLTLVAPVAVGMIIRRRLPGFAKRAEKPMRAVSLLVLLAFSAGAIAKEWTTLTAGFSAVGLTVVAFNLLSLAVGYFVPRALQSDHAAALAIAFELGVRSAVLAIYIAMTTLQSVEIALPAAVYSITMVLCALSFGSLVRSRDRPRSDQKDFCLTS
jgi:bile acid:Na+ symporter, BASS family